MQKAIYTLDKTQTIRLPHGCALMKGSRKIWHPTMPVSGSVRRLQKSNG
jgi:hypothetical protein